VRSLLIVLALTGAAHGQVRRTPLVWRDIVVGGNGRPQREAAWQFGIGASTWHMFADVVVGYHVHDRLQLRMRERVFAHEGEVAFALAKQRRRTWTYDSWLRSRVFVLAGGGIDNDGRGYPFAGAMVRLYRFSNVDWMTLEVGARTMSITRTEIFATISVVK